MMRWNWKLYVLREAIMYHCIWQIRADNPKDTIFYLLDRLHHMTWKAEIIRRAHR